MNTDGDRGNTLVVLADESDATILSLELSKMVYDTLVEVKPR